MGWLEWNSDRTRVRGKYRRAGKKVGGPWFEYPHLAERWLTAEERAAEAPAVVDLVAVEAAAGEVVAPQTLAEYASAWLARRTPPRVKKETFRFYRTHVTIGILDDPLGRIAMAELDRDDVEDWLVRMDPRGHAARNSSLKVLRMVCASALGSRKCPMTVDPTYKLRKRPRERRAVDADNPNAKTGDRVYIAKDQVDDLIAATGDDDDLRLQVLLGVEAGLRWSEIAALSVDAITSTGHGMTINVCRSLGRDGVVVNDTKNHRDRLVPVLDPALHKALTAGIRRARLRGAGDGRGALLFVHKTSRRFGKLLRRKSGSVQASYPIPGSTRRVRREFSTEVEAEAWLTANAPAPQPLLYGASRLQFEALVKAADLYPVPLGWHDLRHTFVSRLQDDGMPMPMVAELVGHTTLATTLNYTHVAPAVVEAQFRAIHARRSA